MIFDSYVPVLEEINMTLERGKIGMVVGPSGCGKTSLLMVIGGMVEPDRGQCEVLGKNLYDMPSNEKIIFLSKTIGFVFQQINLFPSLSAIENIALPLIVDGVGWDEALFVAHELMVEFGLKLHVHSKLNILSGGQKQRVAIARAIIRSPSLIICDEPTSNLDINTTQATLEILQQTAVERNCTFVISTHNRQILKSADQILELSS